MKKILIVEDEESIRNVLVEIIRGASSDFEVLDAVDGRDAYKKFQEQDFDLILSDIKMPGMDGVELLEKIKVEKPSVAVIMTSGHGDLEVAVDCIKKGAYDYITKPPDLNRLLTTVKNAMKTVTLQKENIVLKKKVTKKYTIVGESNVLQEVRDMIDKVSPTDARIFVNGANGTGKELVARNVHEQSLRSKAPFIEVNCAAIPSELIESELFGHEKGSFTGAYKQKIGKFELASGGTLFLDEIGDMSVSTQAKVLRALQENKITRVGGEKGINVSPRVIVATNKDLKEEIGKGNFREDLYHRLAVIIINVPTLEERREDIPLLIDSFVTAYKKEQGMSKKKFTSKAVKALQEMSWTGNIRELKNVVERLMILGGESIDEKEVKMFSMK